MVVDEEGEVCDEEGEVGDASKEITQDGGGERTTATARRRRRREDDGRRWQGWKEAIEIKVVSGIMVMSNIPKPRNFNILPTFEGIQIHLVEGIKSHLEIPTLISKLN